mmetsp:Transcript_75593/g.218384  ORF Transcript_75593/g.218384 Transcript_75593/m.218384 type:complete len:110 (+) Transcript_75593:258-587(+)
MWSRHQLERIRRTASACMRSGIFQRGQSGQRPDRDFRASKHTVQRWAGASWTAYVGRRGLLTSAESSFSKLQGVAMLDIVTSVWEAVFPSRRRPHRSRLGADFAARGER